MPLVEPRDPPLPDGVARVIEVADRDVNRVVLDALLPVAVLQPKVHEDGDVGGRVEGPVEGGKVELLDRASWHVGPKGEPQEEGREPERDDEAEAALATAVGHGICWGRSLLQLA